MPRLWCLCSDPLAMISILRPLSDDLYAQTPRLWSLCSDPLAMISMLRPIGYDLYSQISMLRPIGYDLYCSDPLAMISMLRPLVGYSPCFRCYKWRTLFIELFLIGRRHRREGEHFRSARDSWLVRHRHRRGHSVRGKVKRSRARTPGWSPAAWLRSWRWNNQTWRPISKIIRTVVSGCTYPLALYTVPTIHT